MGESPRPHTSLLHPTDGCCVCCMFQGGWSQQGCRVPLCHFLFSHPFRVGDVCRGTLPLPTRPHRLPALAPLTWRRGRSRARRRDARHYPAHLRAQVILHPLGHGGAPAPRSPPTIQELLFTVRDAWPPPRSLSLDSEKREKSKARCEGMGTGSKQSAPRMGLPYRRYSVPETVMRKFSLSRAQTSASDVKTVPTPSVPSIGTSQDSATRRMAHKACQTSPQDSVDTGSPSASTCDQTTIPTVNIIPSNPSASVEEEPVSKCSSSELSPSEEVSNFSESDRRLYQSELSLPGLIPESSMFLAVPELVLDPNDSPKNSSMNDNVFSSAPVTISVDSACVADTKRISDILNEKNFTNLLEQNELQQRSVILRSKSNSIPESPEHSEKIIRRTGSANDKNLIASESMIKDLVAEDDNLENQMNNEETPTPALTCHTYDSQENMSGCYITDCDICTAEGRKCCNVDDSGSQSCSFTSPEMVTTNDLKSSSDYTTSSMTLDQTVSDRTTSTQDSTVSLTSITPESAEGKNAGINISPILVIDSEAILVDLISPRNKSKDREIFHPSESSQSDSTKSDSQPPESMHLFPAIISCESAIVPENNTLPVKILPVSNSVQDDDDHSNQLMLSPIQSVAEETTYPELNNNKLPDTKHSIEENIELTDDKPENEELDQHVQKGNYSTNYMYLTEDESGVNFDSLEVDRDSTAPKESEDDFEMDSLAINESTEEDSNLLENLGFCEDLSKYEPTTAGGESLISNINEIKVQDKFYGNTKYELILQENAANKSNFLGNVMPTQEGKSLTKPQKEPFCTVGSVCLSKNIDLNAIELLDENKCAEDQVLSDRETTMGSVAGGTYWELPGKDLVIPRFSALPRTLSMIVNTSSMDCSSDSDLSLADSLEDSKSDDKSKGLKLYNKYDNRLVRGDVIALLPEETESPKKSVREGKAYFLSLAGEEGEIRVEPIPEELKQKLLKRENELKKHSGHLLTHVKRLKGKNNSKRSKKHHHHHHHNCASTNTSISPKNNSQELQSLESVDKITKCTQWEDLGSSKDSSDTLVPSDFSEKDKDTVFNGEYKTTEVSTSPFLFDNINEIRQNSSRKNMDTTIKLEQNVCEFNKNISLEVQSERNNINNDLPLKEKFANKWIQCENMPHIDNFMDEEISKLLIENLESDKDILNPLEQKQFKCVEHQVPWSKDIHTQVYADDLVLEDLNDNSIVNNIAPNRTSHKSISIQTSDETLKQSEGDCQVKESLKTTGREESNVIKLNLTGSLTDKYCGQEDEIKLQVEGDEPVNQVSSSKEPFHGEKQLTTGSKLTKQQDKVYFSKHTTKFNMKVPPTRRPGNISSRFRQKFEVIPEEKSGSMDSSNDEKKSPMPPRGRRPSLPSDITMADIGQNENKSSDSSSSGNGKQENDVCDHIRNIQTSQDGGDYHRRHTIHGNLASRNTKLNETNNSFEKNEQSRRHTIHGSLALNSKNESMLKQLNLLGGTLLKGRVFGKQSGVMFGRFRPVNEETQVQKDERSLVEEHIERLRRNAPKGREALAVAKTEEQEELISLSKGWINFYLLRDSQEMGSDCSTGDEVTEDRGKEKLNRTTPSMKTVTVVGKPDDELIQQYTVHINATPEPFSGAPAPAKLPDLGAPLKYCQTPCASPDITLPDITPTSSPTTSPLQADVTTPHRPERELPHISTKGSSHHKHKRNGADKHKPSSKKPPDRRDNDQNVRYMKLSSMKQELQTEKTYIARSGEIACSELSQTSQSSSSSVAADSPSLPSIKWPSRQLQRRSHRRPPPPPHNNSQACWTVTLAGSSGHPTQPPPDVEMRLSFSNAQRGTATSQSDSGLGEEAPVDKVKKQQALPSALAQSNQWKVMLKSQQEAERSSEFTKGEKRTSLPDFSYTPSTARSKKSSKPVFDREKTRPDHSQSKSKRS